jgi:hypothetical protein
MEGMTLNNIRVKDKFDIESAEKIVRMGYPKNADYISDMIFWSCFPDPVSRVFYPYVESLPDSILATHLPEFLEFHLSKNQETLIDDVFAMIINHRGQSFRDLVLSACKTEALKSYLLLRSIVSKRIQIRRPKIKCFEAVIRFG